MVKELIKISKYAGMREDLVQASGGNSSVKLSDGKMIIKGLGIQLADVNENFGYATVDLNVFRNFFRQYHSGDIGSDTAEKLQERAFLKGCKPAVETYFHALTDRVTLHTHPELINVLTSRKGGMEVLRSLFPDALMLNYAAPGLSLGIELYEKMESQTSMSFSGIAFMKNHGLLVSGKTADEVIAETEYVIERVATYLKYENYANSNVTKIYQWLAQKTDMSGKIVYCTTNRKIISGQAALSKKQYMFCPDGIVFCGKEILVLDEGKEIAQIEKYIADLGCPSVLIYQRNVYIIASSIKKAKEIESVVAFCSEVAELNRGFDMDFLTDKEADYLLNWEVEKYRKNMQ